MFYLFLEGWINGKWFIQRENEENDQCLQIDLQLILDFRPILNLTQIPYVGVAGGTIAVPVNMINNAESTKIGSTVGGVTVSPSTTTTSQFVDVTIPSGKIDDVYPLEVEYTLINGDIEIQTINIIQRW